MEPVVANPWSVVPIKNAKYAKSCSEIHLSNRNIEYLSEFEHFPNLEVLYLNNNKLVRLEGLDRNVCIKQLYVENNRLTTLKGSLPRFKFLETLLLGGNNLRGLDGILEILGKFTILQRLNLYGNTCSQEPYYRLKVIHAIPSLKVLDRHEITLTERNRAAQLVASLKSMSTGKKQRSKRTIMSHSIIEKELARQVRQIRESTQIMQKQKEENEKVVQYSWDHLQGKPPPVNNLVQTNLQYFGQNQDDKVSEWEKNYIKIVFQKYDKNRSGFLDLEELTSLIEDLRENKAGIGKIPAVDTQDIVSILNKWDKNHDGKIHWREFRNGMNSWQWRIAPPEMLQKSIKQLYKQARREELGGKLDAAKDLVIKALKLEGAESKSEQSIPVYEKEQAKNIRNDTFQVFRFAQEDRDTGYAKTIYNSTKPYKMDRQQTSLN